MNLHRFKTIILLNHLNRDQKKKRKEDEVSHGHSIPEGTWHTQREKEREAKFFSYKLFKIFTQMQGQIMIASFTKIEDPCQILKVFKCCSH